MRVYDWREYEERFLATREREAREREAREAREERSLRELDDGTIAAAWWNMLGVRRVPRPVA